MSADAANVLGFLGSFPERAFFHALDGAPDALVLIDSEGTVRFINAQAERLFGYSRQELVGKPIEILVPPRFKSQHAVSRDRFMHHATVRPMGSGLELHGQRKDGTEFPVEISLSPLETEHGLFVSSAIRDITERKQAELTTNLLAAIVGSSEDAIISVTPEGIITSWNHGAARVFGYAAQAAMGQPLSMLQTSDSEQALLSAMDRVRSGAYVEQFESVGRHRDGHAVHLSVTLSPIRDARGALVGASQIARDVTEQKRMEANAALATQRLFSAIESIQGLFALFDAEDRLVLCNSEFRQFFASAAGRVVGCRFETLVEKSLEADIFAVDEESAEALQARWVAYHRNPVGTLDLRTSDGQTLRVADRPTAEGGVVTTIWDITADVRREDELRQARLVSDAANTAKSEFLASMSHELRTPLNAVLGFAQLLWRDKKTPLTERQKERVGHILKGGEHLLRLIDDVLDLSRIEAGRLTMSIEPVSVDEVLQEVERTLEPMAARLGTRLALGPVPEGSACVRADRTRFAQVLINYGSNAIKYGKSGGMVVFAVSQPDADTLRVSVRDDGSGIPLDKHDKIFMPFQRAGQELGPIEGTGIGLTICKRVSELMGGSVGFDSTPGRGSEFWIDLPLFQAEPEPLDVVCVARDALAAMADVTGPRHLVLYVEDNPSNIAFMRELMHDFDSIELIVAPTAELGLETARARRPKVIIMDINLPGMNGIEAAHALRAMPETSKIPIVALSAAAMKSDRQKAQVAVFHRYLTKPVKVDELMETLEPLLGTGDDSQGTSRHE